MTVDGQERAFMRDVHELVLLFWWGAPLVRGLGCSRTTFDPPADETLRLGLMGQQIAAALSPEDEQRLLAFLRESAEISIYRSWSPQAEPVKEFSPEPEASPFYIHNRTFSWVPEFERVEYTEKNFGRTGYYHRLSNTNGPLLEYSRHPIQAQSPQVSGRIYWSKFFLMPRQEVQYDVALFAAWYSRVASWVRRHGKRVTHGTTEPWCLPGARRLLAHDDQPLTRAGLHREDT